MPSSTPNRLHRRPLIRPRGQVLFDALVALLLLATTLLGTGLTLVQAMAANRATALHTSAVDLTADLTETLEHASPAERPSLFPPWLQRVSAALPGGQAQAVVAEGAGNPRLDIRLQWRDHADGRTVTLLMPLLLAPQVP